MNLFIFDYQDTLTRLSDPVAFVKALKEKDPSAQVVLYTGTDKERVEATHPSLWSTVDAVWEKPCFIKDYLMGMVIERVVLVDDDVNIRQTAQRILRGIPTIPDIAILEPDALPGLLLG